MRHYLIQDIEVEGKLVNRVHTFQHLAAQWTLNLIVAKEVTQTVSAEGMATPHNDPGDTGAYIVLESAEVAVVEATRFIVGRDDWLLVFGVSHFIIIFQFTRLIEVYNY